MGCWRRNGGGGSVARQPAVASVVVVVGVPLVVVQQLVNKTQRKVRQAGGTGAARGCIRCLAIILGLLHPPTASCGLSTGGLSVALESDRGAERGGELPSFKNAKTCR